MNCENSNFPAYKQILETISQQFGPYLDNLNWVSLGGGVSFTSDGYPLEELASLLKWFSDKHGVQIYLEPGEAVITKTTDLVVTVVDIVENGLKMPSIYCRRVDGEIIQLNQFGYDDFKADVISSISVILPNKKLS